MNEKAARRAEEAPLVDTDALVCLQEQTGDVDGELLQELVAVFIEDARAACERLQQLAHGGPSETIAREAHRLKSGAANLGAVRMTALCRALEAAGATGGVEETRELIGALCKQLPAVERQLRDYLEGELRTVAYTG